MNIIKSFFIYSPCDNNLMISYNNFENIKYYKNKLKFNWNINNYNTYIYSDNYIYYHIYYYNSAKFSTCNTITYNSIDFNNLHIIGKIIYNPIASIDLPIIKPIKLI